MQTPDNLPFYQVGGSLDANSPTYVKRQADYQLYESLQRREYCYVLNSRQMGKSSLRVRTMARLEEEGVRCAAIDLTIIGTNVAEDSWYKGIFIELVKQFELGGSFNRRQWWDEHASISPIQKLDIFFEEILLANTQENLVIFIDEIDSVLRLKFLTGDFFAFIRACFNKRTDNSHYNRLAFCLLGVANPTDLIRNKYRTPFNIGQRIELTGFSDKEAQPLAQGLKELASNTSAVIRRILAWTGGQPFLTQKICNLIVSDGKSIPHSQESAFIDKLVRDSILNNWENQDNPQHLKTIRQRLLDNESDSRKLLEIYQKILQKQGIYSDNNPETIKLRLSGLVVCRNNKIEVYNPIYKQVFNENWVRQELAKLSPYAEQLNLWLDSGKDESLLLPGQDLQGALDWSKAQNLSNVDYQFLYASQALANRREIEAERQKSNQRAQKLLGSKFDNNAVEIVDHILFWTAGQRELTGIVSKLIVDSEDKIPEGEEEKWVEELVDESVVKNWKKGEAAAHLKEVRNRFCARNDQEVLEMLQNYHQILQGKVSADYSPEQQQLLETGLVVVNSREILEVPNLIYLAVFDLKWIEQEINNLNQNKNSSGVLTKGMSVGVLITLFITLFFSLQNNPNQNQEISQDSNPPSSQIDTSSSSENQTDKPKSNFSSICSIRDENLTLEENIELLKETKIKSSRQCQTQLRELNALRIAPMEAKNGRNSNAFEKLCSIREDSNNLQYAENQLRQWYNSEEYWKNQIKTYFDTSNTPCPAAQQLRTENNL